jgi:hypothetical protein
VAFEAPAGEHTVAIRVRPTPIYLLGQIASGLAVLGLAGLYLHEKRTLIRAPLSPQTQGARGEAG